MESTNEDYKDNTGAAFLSTNEISSERYPLSMGWMVLEVFKSFFWAVFLLFLLFYFLLRYTGEISTHFLDSISLLVLSVIFLFSSLVLVGLYGLLTFYRRYDFKFTESGLIGKLIHRGGKTILPYTEITDFSLKYGIIDRLFGFVSILIVYKPEDKATSIPINIYLKSFSSEDGDLIYDLLSRLTSQTKNNYE